MDVFSFNEADTLLENKFKNYKNQKIQFAKSYTKIHNWNFNHISWQSQNTKKIWEK